MKKTVDFVGADLAICSDRPTQHLIDQGCRRPAMPRSIRGGIGWGVEGFPWPTSPGAKGRTSPRWPQNQRPDTLAFRRSAFVSEANLCLQIPKHVALLP